MALADDIAAVLGELPSLTYEPLAATGNVFVDQMPSKPDRAVCVYSTAGPEADSKLPYDPATFQIQVRSEEGGTWAVDIWAAIYSKLHGLRYVTLPSGQFMAYCLATQSSPFRLGPDENGRPSYTGNYRTEVLNETTERST